MGDRTTEEYFLKVLDEGLSSIEGDSLGEWHESYDYTVMDSSNDGEYKEALSSCHKCTACFNRRVYAEPILNKNPLVLFVLPAPEGDTLLNEASYSYFTKWVKAIGLSMERVALSTLIKCPSPEFSKAAADSCRDYLREEIGMLKPSSIVLLGADTAHYMLRRNLPFDEIRLHKYKINGIKTFVTYTPLELVKDRSKRTLIWEDLKFISNNTVGEESRE